MSSASLKDGASALVRYLELPQPSSCLLQAPAKTSDQPNQHHHTSLTVTEWIGGAGGGEGRGGDLTVQGNQEQEQGHGNGARGQWDTVRRLFSLPCLSCSFPLALPALTRARMRLQAATGLAATNSIIC